MTNNDLQKTVLLGVTGCIAAYKSAEIVRALQKRGHRVKVVMTDHACEFIGPTTFRALTREKVAVGLFDDPADPIHHISLAQEADVFLIAPCTANVMAKIAQGIADDLLTTTALATKAPLIIAPAMNVGMYENVATQSNKATLESRGVRFVDADEGYLACGDTGKGRLADVDVIADAVDAALGASRDLAGKTVLITAGPTVEPLDPVRFISNHSSGKMGYALAEVAALRGAKVILVSGPTSLDVPVGLDRFVPVNTACEMYDAVQKYFEGCDIALCAAAVSDMRPVEQKTSKMKKADVGGLSTTLELVENPDILASIGHTKTDQVVVGFAAETDNVLTNAKQKLVSKAADCIIANEVGEGKGFNVDHNKVWLVDAEGTRELAEASKITLASQIFDYLNKRFV